MEKTSALTAVSKQETLADTEELMMSGLKDDSDEKLEGLRRILDARDAQRAERAAAEKARWDFYYDQLAKAVPFQGGAKKNPSRGQIVRYE